MNQLETALKKSQLWDDEQPSLEQLSSCEPFCVDTLRFEQWLQWIFIPKMSQIVATPNFNGLVHRSDIHTMSDYAFRDYPQDTKKINQLIKQLDDSLNQFNIQTKH